MIQEDEPGRHRQRPSRPPEEGSSGARRLGWATAGVRAYAAAKYLFGL
ncbi:MAG: hypothetical protein AVDCRST_MAG55-2329 [uncultured Rubrobacteraceae bacterium]|uniref:Uncharacterized protein n=1 Tax=uncultured Rubrobacteraceae bacterium TaxID=349277 RepID=A0A6J4PX61_9ACTN|nr:MAG: hypothetical protein AVDCRST_MAG55-2329 [uncultured Rubrobacteraceae bacterium]